MVTLIGYHGTNKTNGLSILKDKKFKFGGKDTDWLGEGIYFFESDPHQAYMFAKFKDKSNRLCHKDIMVLFARISVNKSNVLDLLTDEDRMFITEYANKVEANVNEKKEEIGDWKHKEGYIIDLLLSENPDYNIKIVRASYEVPKAKKNKNLNFSIIHIQLCVKSTGCDCIRNRSIKEVNCDAYKSVQTKSIRKIR